MDRSAYERRYKSGRSVAWANAENDPWPFLSSLKDEIVPKEHMHTLYSLCRPDEKSLLQFEGVITPDPIVLGRPAFRL